MDFVVHDAAGHSARAAFIFDSENGGIDGWNPGVGATGPGPSTVTEVAVKNGANAVYKGLAQAVASDGHTYLYAANFRSGRVEAYDNTFTPVELPGGLFVDTKIPAGYAPFNVQELAGQLYVSYAKQDATLHDDVAGQGNGFVDVFTNDGAFVKRLVTRGQLNSPWGLALAPASFGRFGGALLVGNFGNGKHQRVQHRKLALVWASCEAPITSRSPSMGCGACGSATGTPLRPANSCSAPDLTGNRTACSARSSPSADRRRPAC